MRNALLAARLALILPLACPPAFAANDDSAAIMAQLKKADAAARQGDLSFVETRIDYQNGKKVGYAKNRIHLQYSGPKEYRQEMRSSRPGKSWTAVQNSDAHFMISHWSKPINGNVTEEVGITGKPISDAMPWLGPAPEANYAIGRGLSTLDDLSVTRKGGKIVVTGTRMSIPPFARCWTRTTGTSPAPSRRAAITRGCLALRCERRMARGCHPGLTIALRRPAARRD
jgi:hypothetical protein